MTYEEFTSQVRKLNTHKKHKITGSLGIYDSYKWIRKNKWLKIGQSLTEHQYYTIIRSINKKLGQVLASGVDIKLPHQLGILEVRKTPSRLAIKDGKLVTNYPIDWKATVDLWYNDEEAYNNKTLIRREVKELYGIYYNKSKAKYNNKKFFEFFPNREIKKALANNVLLNKVEAFLYTKW